MRAALVVVRPNAGRYEVAALEQDVAADEYGLAAEPRAFRIHRGLVEQGPERHVVVRIGGDDIPVVLLDQPLCAEVPRRDTGARRVTVGHDGVELAERSDHQRVDVLLRASSAVGKGVLAHPARAGCARALPTAAHGEI